MVGFDFDGQASTAVVPENPIRADSPDEGEFRASSDTMLAVLHLIGMFVVDWFKSPRRLEVENLFLQHQLNIALRRAPHRLRLRGSDRAIIGMDDLALAKPARFVPCRSA